MGRDSKRHVRRLLCVLVASVILHDDTAPAYLSTIATNALDNEDTDLDSMHAKIHARAALSSGGAAPKTKKGQSKPPDGCT